MTTEIKYLTKKDAIKAVTQNGTELQFCSKELQNDKEIVMAAIKENEWSFCYASNEFKANKHFILKAINDGVYPWGLIKNASTSIHSDIEVITLAVEKSDDGWEFACAQGKAALNKELAAKALVKWGNRWGASDLDLWKKIHPTLKKLFPRNCWFKKAQFYLYQLKQEQQAEMVTGGCIEEDGVVW